MQKSILFMYKDLLQACRLHNITPYLIGGSALGAVRHQGFIPWDDDIDVGMTRVDYDHFVDIFYKELSDKYILMPRMFLKNRRLDLLRCLKREPYVEKCQIWIIQLMVSSLIFSSLRIYPQIGLYEK